MLIACSKLIMLSVNALKNVMLQHQLSHQQGSQMLNALLIAITNTNINLLIANLVTKNVLTKLINTMYTELINAVVKVIALTNTRTSFLIDMALMNKIASIKLINTLNTVLTTVLLTQLPIPLPPPPKAQLNQSSIPPPLNQ